MNKHICRKCQKTYDYCRGCLISPILYKEVGFCSKECYESSKIKFKPIVEEVVETISVEDIAPIEEEVSVEVKAETIVEEDAPTEVAVEAIVSDEATAVVESTIKQETNTYKKKKNKYKYTSSY
jgi:hypothetical protein